MNRRGFTLVELIAVIAILGLLASIALPKYHGIRTRAQAADVIGAMLAVRTGAFNYNGTAGAWPPSRGFGTVPPGLGAYLPGGLSFRTADYRLAWRTIRVRVNGRPTQVQSVQARMTDGVLCQAVAGLLGGQANSAVTYRCPRRNGTVVWLVDQ